MRLEVYTDGSANHLMKTAGVGVVIVSSDGTFAEHSKQVNGTNNEAELLAITFGLQLAEAQSQEPCEIVVFTDSQCCIGWLTGKFSCSSPSVRTMLVEFTRLLNGLKQQGFSVGVQYVAGHVGHTWNELAHSLAKQAMKLSGSQKETCWL